MAGGTANLLVNISSVMLFMRLPTLMCVYTWGIRMGFRTASIPDDTCLDSDFSIILIHPKNRMLPANPDVLPRIIMTPSVTNKRQQD